MIGLGSNRLTVCRRGGMSVTQAGRGGMEWLAGGRRPSWASPYSAQATAALKDAFTAAQWQTIKAYGFAHPEIVGYMNAYAPEDAKIAYSLVEGIGTRWLVGDGTAYIDSGWGNTVGYRAITKVRKNSQATNSMSGIAGSTYNSGNNYWRSSLFLSASQHNLQVWNVYGGTNYNFVQGTAYDIEWATFTSYYLKINGTTVKSGTVSFSASSPYNIFVFSSQYRNAPDATAKGWEMPFIKIYDDSNVLVRYFVPYISRTQGMGMLDLVEGEFHPNMGTGTFTELIDSPS